MTACAYRLKSESSESATEIECAVVKLLVGEPLIFAHFRIRPLLLFSVYNLQIDYYTTWSCCFVLAFSSLWNFTTLRSPRQFWFLYFS
jgi:hypothetical protein